MNRDELRNRGSLATAYVRSAGIGVLLGSGLGLVAAYKTASERTSAQAGDVLTFVAMGCTVGVLAGVVFQALAPLRNRGRASYVLSWMLAIAPATFAAVLPDVIFRDGAWLDLVLAAGLGAGAGLGLGLFAYAYHRVHGS